MRRQSAVSDSDTYRTKPESGTNRRAFLAGTAAVAAGLAMTGSVTADDDYDVILDIVDDLGADNTGGEPINDALADAVEHDSVKVTFPSGEYVIHEGEGGDGFARWDFGEGEEVARVGKLALVGQEDTVLRPLDGGRHSILTLWGRDITVRNFRIDQTGHDTSTGITTVAEENLLVSNIHFDGKVTGDYVETPHWQSDDYDESVVPEDPTCLIPGLLNEDGVGRIENVRAPDGVESHSRKGAVWVNFLHAGDLLFEACEFSNFSDNAIYGSPPGLAHGNGGSVRVENCYFKNNNVTAIRLGTPGSYAKHCTVVTEADEIPATPWGAITSRAGWVWYDFEGSYEDIDVIHNHPNGQGIVEEGSHDGWLEVRDSRIELNNGGANAIRYVDGGSQLTLENLSITGEASGDAAIRLGSCELDAENVCIHQTGSGRDGFSLSSVTGTIADSVVDVTGDQFVASGSTDVAVTNLHDAGDCPSADPNHDFDSVSAGPTPSRPDGSGRDETVTGDAEGDGDGVEADHDFRLSDVDMEEAVPYQEGPYQIGSATVTNHGDETATAPVGVWSDFFEDFLGSDVAWEEVTLEPGESTTVTFYLDGDISRPGAVYEGLKISTLSDEYVFDLEILEGDDASEEETDDADSGGDDDSSEGETDDSSDEETTDNDEADTVVEDDDTGTDSDQAVSADDDGSPGFTGIITLGALAATSGAMIRRLRSDSDEQ